MARDYLELPAAEEWPPPSEKINLRARDSQGNKIWLEVGEAAREANVDESTIYRWMRRRKMSVKILGGTYLYRPHLMAPS